MSEVELIRKVAHLEFENDQLISEIHYVDALLRSIGFPEGLDTVKRAAADIQAKEFEEGDLD